MTKAESKYFNTSVKMSDALLDLLKTKPFAYITISEICKKAGVNRSTFYLHYENTADLLAETGQRLLDDFRSYFMVDTVALTAHFADCEEKELNFITEEYLHPYLSYIRDNRHVFATILKHANSFHFDAVFQRLFQHVFDPILHRFGYPAEERKYVMMFYLSGINALVLEWLKDG
ncbi:MAG: TetR/AcrR family transcriptional regulator, partial [Oscillospiraceae bacterium]|nr:TetR/AcrR family transcriptional regulator [Oscillospiraceae bacterium]